MSIITAMNKKGSITFSIIKFRFFKIRIQRITDVVFPLGDMIFQLFEQILSVGYVLAFSAGKKGVLLLVQFGYLGRHKSGFKSMSLNEHKGNYNIL